MMYNNELCEAINMKSKNKIYKLGYSLKNGRLKDFSIFRNEKDFSIFENTIC